MRAIWVDTQLRAIFTDRSVLSFHVRQFTDFFGFVDHSARFLITVGWVWAAETAHLKLPIDRAVVAEPFARAPRPRPVFFLWRARFDLALCWRSVPEQYQVPWRSGGASASEVKGRGFDPQTGRYFLITRREGTGASLRSQIKNNTSGRDRTHDLPVIKRAL